MSVGKPTLMPDPPALNYLLYCCVRTINKIYNVQQKLFE